MVLSVCTSCQSCYNGYNQTLYAAFGEDDAAELIMFKQGQV